MEQVDGWARQRGWGEEVEGGIVGPHRLAFEIIQELEPILASKTLSNE